MAEGRAIPTVGAVSDADLMRLHRLRIEGLRSLTRVELEGAPQLNLLEGPNGSGKTSVLEAIHLLSHGRSFRPGGHPSLTARGRDGYAVFGELVLADGRQRRVGMAHSESGWRLRLDGESVAALGEFVRASASICFEPGSHALLSGPAGGRRRYLDWGVFHVEHAFLALWQRYQRALRQRNALLRQGAGEDLLVAWEAELVQAGEVIDRWRRAYVERLQVVLEDELGCLVPSLGAVRMQYLRGWANHESLGEGLRRARERDRQRGYTGAGPHRADWQLRFEAVERHDQLSRGQEKLVALGCVLAQGVRWADDVGSWPIVCLDDLPAELDQEHQHRVLDRLAASRAQVWLTATERPSTLADRDVRVFHVEHGEISGRG